MSSELEIRKIFIKSETDINKTYSIIYAIWKNDITPRDIICSCPGYQYHGKCKHIIKYDPANSNLWKYAKCME